MQFVIGDWIIRAAAGRRYTGHPAVQPSRFVTPEMDLALNTPHLAVETSRDKSADLGVSVASIGRTLETLLSGRPVNTFMQNGRQYKVIVKVDERYRATPSDISKLYVRGMTTHWSSSTIS